MIPPERLHYGGVMGILGGAIWAADGVLRGFFPAALLFVAPLLMALCLAGFYLPNREHLRGLGQSGFTQGVIGLVLLSGGFFGAYVAGDEGLLQVAAFGFLITAFGLVLTGYACLKEGMLPHLDWLPLVLGAVAPLGLLFGDGGFTGVALPVVFGAGWMVFGVLVLTRYGRSRKHESGGNGKSSGTGSA